MTVPATRPRTGVVTVSFGSAAVLDGFLASISEASSDPVDIVVADNRGESSVQSQVERVGATYLGMPHNDGYGAGVNAAVKELPPEVEWVLVSNPDIKLQRRAIDLLLDVATADDRVGAVGPRVETQDGALYPSAREIPSIRNGVGHALFSTIWPGNPWTRRYRSEGFDPRAPRDAGWLSGSCLLVRRSLFCDLGGFDTQYFMYFEDVDLGYRIGRAGFRNVYAPGSVVIHIGGHSTSAGTSLGMIHAHHRSARRFVGRKYRGRVLAPLRLILMAGLAARERILISWSAARRVEQSPNDSDG